VTAPGRDLLSRRGPAFLLYAAPTLAIVAAGAVGASETVVTLVWTLGFTVMGVACVVNAVRCGRLHCYFTGPFLLLVAAAALLHGLHVVSLGSKGWQWLGMVAIAGAIILLTVPERLWGRYAGRTSRTHAP
jgi:hypothetical protein